jgi:hypothetical protein
VLIPVGGKGVRGTFLRLREIAMAVMKKSRKQNSKKVQRVDKPKLAPPEVFVSVPYDYATTVRVSFEVFNPQDAVKEELSHE